MAKINNLSNNFITYKGYKIPLNNEKVNECKKELFVCPFVENPVKYPVFRMSDKYLYIPKYYGINKFGLPPIENIKEQSGTPVEYKFNSNLRDYQIEPACKIYKHLLQKGSGIASLHTGWGKTCMSLWIAHKLGVKTIIIVHTDNLLNQWIEKIEQFLLIKKEDIGIIQGPKLQLDKDIVIGMIQSISMKEYPSDTFKSFGLSICDECFPADTYIHTDQGRKTIATLFNYFENNKLINILSFNQNTKKFEYKPLTYAWKKENKNLVKIDFSKLNLKCTLNHKILTINGYVEADKLNIGDIVLGKYDSLHNTTNICPYLNEDQFQIFYGSYLGDGNISITNFNRYRLKFIHCEKQKEYLFWKAKMFNIEEQYIQKIEKNGYSQKPAYTFSTKCFDLENNVFINNKEISDTIINNIDERGIAIWFMDDGSIHKYIKKDNNYQIIIHSNNFDYNNHLKLVQIFQRYNILAQIKQSKKKFYFLYFDSENTLKVLNLIRKYIHCDFDYKIDYTENSNNKYIWNNNFCDYGTLKVSKKEYIKNETNNVYDIEVMDNHNFIVTKRLRINNNNYIDGPIVSNCHHTPGRCFSKIFYKIGCKYNLGLSATITRADGLTKVIKYFMGDIIVNIKQNLIVPNIYNHYTGIEPIETKTMINGKLNMPHLIGELCKSFERNLEIVKIIKEKYSQNRKILVLTDRRAHCLDLRRLLGEDYSSGLYIGSMKNAALQESNTKRVIFATYVIASEGYDNPELDTLILASPKSNIEQAVGRILRQENENEPLVIDIVDSFSVLINMHSKRMKFYKQKKFNILGINNSSKNNNSVSNQEIKLDSLCISDEFL